MTDKGIRATKAKIIHPLENSSRDLSIVRCVKNTSRSRRRRHRSFRIKQKRTPIHEFELENIPCIRIRPANDSVRVIRRNQSFRSIPSQHSIGSIIPKSPLFLQRSFNESSRCSYTDNHRQHNKSTSQMVIEIPYLHRKKNNGKSKKKRRFCGGYCCFCTPFYIFLISLVIALILSAIAALLIVLIKPQSMSTSTRTAATTITTTSTTSTARPFVSITRAGDPMMGLYNTSAGQSTGGSNGMYSGVAEMPDNAIDGNLNTKYLNFGFQGIMGAVLNEPGINTGFYVIPTISNATIATALLFATANDFPSRDPITITLEGTNATTVAGLNLGSSWILLYSGSTGIHPTIASNRAAYVAQQNFSNTIAFRAYRLLITSQRNLTDCVQYSESQILGYA